MSVAGTKSVNYRPDIDGLRAVAVLAVLFNHAGLGLKGGYVGVDVFFVISGYLITQLILKDLHAGTFGLAQFWERRVRRIMPALVVMVLATLIASWVRLLPQDFHDLGLSVLAQVALISNYYFYTVSGYFEQAAAQKPLLHTWSLAVEEQFYLLFPLVLLAVHRWFRRWLVPMTVLLLAASFTLAVLWSHSHAWANFYFLPTRAWELLLGGLLAAAPGFMAMPRAGREVATLAGLGAILYAVVVFDHTTPMPGLPALLPCGGAALIIAGGRIPTGHALPLGTRLLSMSPLVFIGLISYSLYLWHWPLLVLAQYWDVEPMSTSRRWALVALSMALAVMSWRWVETPFRQRHYLAGRGSLFLAAGTLSVALLGMGGAVVALQGVPSRLPEAAQRLSQGSTDFAFSEGIQLEDAVQGRFTELGAGNRSQPVQVLVWGDSHAMAIMPAIDKLCRDHGVRGLGATYSATAPLIGYDNRNPDSLRENNQAFNEAVIRFIKEQHVRHVLMVARWDGYLEYDHQQTGPLLEGVVATLQALKDSGARVWLMPTVPVYSAEVPKMLASAVIHGQDPAKLGLSLVDYRRANALQMQVFQQALAKTSGDAFRLLDPGSLLTGVDGRCQVVSTDGYSLYRDSHHLAIRGALHLRTLFKVMFEEGPQPAESR